MCMCITPYVRRGFFIVMEKEVPALMRCVTTGNPDGLSKTLMCMFSYIGLYDRTSKTLPPPYPVVLRAMVCTGMYLCPLPDSVKVHPAMDHFMASLREGDVIPDEDGRSLKYMKIAKNVNDCSKYAQERKICLCYPQTSCISRIMIYMAG